MSSGPAPVHLSNNHRDTLLQLFQHPTSHNVEWHAVVSLLEAVGTVEERREGKIHVALGDQSLFLERPKHKDVSVEQIVELRRLLAAAGFEQVVNEMEARGKEV
jgi:hypothetical protein